MSSIDTLDVHGRLTVFYACVRLLSKSEIRALRQFHAGTVDRRAPRALDQDLLLAVVRGDWTAGHQALARESRSSVRRLAREVAPFRARRAVRRTLEDVALAIINAAQPERPLPADLAERLIGPWKHATGHDPHAPDMPLGTAELVRALPLQHCRGGAAQDGDVQRE